MEVVKIGCHRHPLSAWDARFDMTSMTSIDGSMPIELNHIFLRIKNYPNRLGKDESSILTHVSGSILLFQKHLSKFEYDPEECDAADELPSLIIHGFHEPDF